MVDSKLPKQTHQILDCIGLYCPTPVLKTRQEIDKLAIGEVLEVWADDLAAEEDLKAWAKQTGQRSNSASADALTLRPVVSRANSVLVIAASRSAGSSANSPHLSHSYALLTLALLARP